jgi:hypothetical protein
LSLLMSGNYSCHLANSYIFIECKSDLPIYEYYSVPPLLFEP